MSEVRFFFLEGAKECDPAVERWFGEPATGLRLVARTWYHEMRAQGPDVLELLHDGHPTVCVDNIALAYVNVFSAHINIGFYFGSVLNDPAGLLEGTGRFMRHVKVRSEDSVNHVALKGLIGAAYADIKARLGRISPLFQSRSGEG